MTDNQKYGSFNYLKSIICGGLAGMSVDLALFPLDTIKTRIQASIKKENLDYLKHSAKISKYSGLISQIYVSFPAAAVFFSMYDLTKFYLIKKLNFFETPSHMLAAIVGEASQVLVRNPFELVKQNMQLGKYRSVKEAISDIYITNGIRGLYRGYIVTVLREIPFGLIQYPLYEFCKGKYRKNNDITISDICKSGAIAGGVSAFITCPIDVIKTRIMTSGEKKFDFRKFLPTLKIIYKDEGPMKLFSGVHIRVFYITIGGMIFFGTNEYFKSLLNFKHKN